MSTSDTNVYKLPSFSKQAFKLQQEEKKERGTEVSATRAEDTYMQNKHLLQGDFARDAGNAFGAFQEAGVRYKKTGSESDRLAMKEASSQLNLVIGAAKTQSKIAGDQYASAVANQFDGYSISKEEIEKSYANFNNRSWETKFENGKMMVKEGNAFVPINQSSIYSSTPNPANTYMIPKAVQQGKYVLADSFAREFRSVSGASTEEKLSKLNANIDYRFNEGNDPAFISDAAMHYEINDLGKFKGGYSADDRRSAEKRYAEDPQYALEVQESYKKDVAVKFDMYSGSSASGYGNPSIIGYGKKGEEKRDVALFTLDKKVGNIVAVGKDSDGNSYKVIDIGGVTSTQPASEVDMALIEGKAGKIPNVFSSEKSEPVEAQPEQEPQEEMPKQEMPKEQMPGEEQQTENKGFGELELDLPSMRTTGRAAPSPPTESDYSTEIAESKISPKIKFDEQAVSKVVAHWTTDQGRAKSPITPSMIIGVSNKYDIPVEITMAMLATEGNFGISARQKKTKNPFNWGNTTGGDTKKGKAQDKFNTYYDSWEEGIDAWGEGFSRLYRPESGDWSELWEKEFVRKDGKRYATDKNYEKTIASIVNNTIPKYAS